MIRVVKIFLVISLALWGLVGASGNFQSWGETMGSVSAVTTMVTIEGGAGKWQATSNPVIIWAGAIFIAGSKLLMGLMCTLGAVRMLAARGADPATFNAAKTIALAGAGIAVVMLFGGFIVIAESWYELWRSQSELGGALDAAFRYAGMIALIAIFVAMPDD